MIAPKLSKQWWVYPVIPDDINQELIDFPAYMRQMLYNRGIKDSSLADEFLNARYPDLDPFLLLDMEKSVERLLLAIDQAEPIAVYGDYDVDGVSATALMVQVLKSLGGNVTRYIPNRFEEGYGLNTDAIEMLANSGVKVIVTVDCGIRSPTEALYARGKGIDLIISDHHNPSDQLPEAFAVVCPKREGDEYPYKDLAGVGLAYKISQGLYTKRPSSNWNPEDYLNLVALGTVADIVPLTGENRMLVRKGIAHIRLGEHIGLRSLAGVAGKNINQITATDIGFILGPRLNAAGRMDSAIRAYEILITDSISRSGMLAQELENQNSERQKATKVAQEKANTLIESVGLRNIITTFDPEFGQGIVGLVAAKLTDQYYRPSIVGYQEAEFTRASCRSIAEFHITQALDKCADLLVRHGGHSMAAGFTIENKNFDRFVERINEIADKELSGKELRQTLKADLEIPVSELKPTIYQDIEKLQPTGMSNPSAIFISRKVKFSDMRLMGKEGNHLRIVIQGCPINQAVGFHLSEWMEVWRESNPFFDIAYSIEINRYFEKESQQINIRDIQLSTD